MQKNDPAETWHIYPRQSHIYNRIRLQHPTMMDKSSCVRAYLLAWHLHATKRQRRKTDLFQILAQKEALDALEGKLEAHGSV